MVLGFVLVADNLDGVLTILDSAWFWGPDDFVGCQLKILNVEEELIFRLDASIS